MISLFKIPGMTSYVLIILINAMTDLGHKITLQNTIFKAYTGSELIILTAIVNALILLPYIFLFLPAGTISDRFAKTKVIEYAALAAIGITSLILVAYLLGLFWLAFGLTFVLAAQSAIYSPAKYGLIKEMTGNERLSEANALAQSVTIISILAGAVVYSIIFESLLEDASTIPSEILQHIAPIGVMLIGASTLEYLLAKRLVREFRAVAHEEKDEEMETHSFDSLRSHLTLLQKSETIWLSIIGLSILWGVSQVVVAIFGEYLKTTLNVTNTITAQGILSLAGVGMILGASMAGRVSKNHIETGIIPLGSLGITLALFMIPTLHTLWSLGVAILSFGFFSGLFLVPLNALIQFSAPHAVLGKILAGNNLMQNISMVLFLLLTALFGYFDLSSMVLFYFVSTIAFLGTLYTFVKLPQSLIRYLVRMIISFRYTLHVEGLKHIPEGKGILLLGNHISFLDWAILQMSYPKQIRFVMERSYYTKWYMRPFLDFFGVIPISSGGSKSALAKVTQALNAGDTVALFPEGHLSRNGHIGNFQRGFELATKGVTDTAIVPFYIRGLWEDNFSYASSKMKRKRNKEISVHFAPPMQSDATAQEIKQAVVTLSVHSWKNYAQTLPTLQEAWIASAKHQGGRHAMADSSGKILSGHQSIIATLLLASSMKPLLSTERYVGILLPSSVGNSLTTMALLTLGKSILPLDFTASEKTLEVNLQLAECQTIITSELFLRKLTAKGVLQESFRDHYQIITIESLQKERSLAHSFALLLLVKLLPSWLLNLLFIDKNSTDETAAILFAPDTEETSKGIELSHTNLMGNIKQTTTLLNPKEEDSILGVLPSFHSFGFTLTTLLPLIEGIPVIYHPNPMDAVAIGKLAARYEATILFAYPQLLAHYATHPKLHPLMFDTLRLVVSGASPLSFEVRDTFKEKFGKVIYEGYGVTETTPVASCNISDVLLLDIWKPQIGHKIGTVGLPLPGSAFRIVNPETFVPLRIGETGRILIGGTQIMKGYFNNPQKSASVIKEIDGIIWFITQDKGYLDQDGFLTLVGEEENL